MATSNEKMMEYLVAQRQAINERINALNAFITASQTATAKTALKVKVKGGDTDSTATGWNPS